MSDPTEATGLALITLDAGGQNNIIVVSGSNMELTPEMVDAAWTQLGDVEVVVMPLEVPLDCVLRAAELGKKGGAKVILNPAPARDLPPELFPFVDVLVPNESETSLLTGLDLDSPTQIEAAADQLMLHGVGSVVLTLGSRGALVLEKGTSAVHIHPFQVEVVDTTAAGDAFVAGLAVSLAEGLSLIESAMVANAVGALATTGMGAQPAMPSRKNVQTLLERAK